MDDIYLPEELRKKATNLGGELAWSISDAREVVKSLHQQDLAVVGVEIWLHEGSNPKVFGWSTYRVEFRGDWKDFVDKNADYALSEIEKPIPNNAFVNLTWLTRAEFPKT